ncbi:GAP family protein [Paenibacillus ihumii]|uniref:GAP family protein n=1 Tax=Paenibacillus ihumii TaxID=687436 RepID=UPI0006D7BB7C|nr:GAP family protein [Paenibacillus ihumii]
MSIELLLSVGGLALLDTLSPATIGVTVYLLLTEIKSLASRLLIYLLTVAGFYFSVGVMLMLGMGVLLEAVASLFQSRAVSWVIFIIGAGLFIASFYTPQKSKTELPRPKSKSRISMVALGFTTALIEVGTALPYFAAIGLMTTADLVPVQWLPMLGGYNLIMVLPSLILFMLYGLFGRRVQRLLERLQERIAKQSGSVLSWVLCIVGLILIFNSLDYL